MSKRLYVSDGHVKRVRWHLRFSGQSKITVTASYSELLALLRKIARCNSELEAIYG